MAVPNERRARLTIDVSPELRRQIKVAAAIRDLSVREFVEAALLRALTEQGRSEDQVEQRAWSQLSAQSFARDWDSEEDAVYDQLDPR